VTSYLKGVQGSVTKGEEVNFSLKSCEVIYGRPQSSSTNDELFAGVNIDDLIEWPCIIKIKNFSVFGDFWLQGTHGQCIALKWLEIDQDNLQTGTAKAVARFMSFA